MSFLKLRTRVPVPVVRIQQMFSLRIGRKGVKAQGVAPDEARATIPPVAFSFLIGVAMKPVLFRVGIFVVGVLVAGAVDASAQMLQSTDKVFAGLSFGNQTKARTFTTSGSQPLYDETASFESQVGIGSESLLDISGGVRVWKNVAVGLGWSSYSDTSTGTMTASIPDPLFFDTPHSASTTVEGLEHKETQIHVSLYWLQPLTDKLDVALYGGPTFFSVKQDVLTGITVPTGGTTISAVTTTTIDESATGLHVGLDIRYLIIKNAGVGAFARYTSGKFDTTAIDAGSMEVGGFQYGVGLRVRF